MEPHRVRLPAYPSAHARPVPQALDVSYEEALRSATEARIRSDAEPERAGSYEERFAAIIADRPPDVVEGILSVCEQIAHLPGLRK